MASAKDLKKKIRSIGNTKKITRTMEMVATVRSKQAQDRIKATTPYSDKLAEILQGLSQSGSIDHPFLKPPAEVKKTLVLVITANRGLCGGYNSNVLSMAEKWIAAETQAGRALEVQVIGKKGIARFRFKKSEVHKTYTHFEDKPSFKDAEEIADELMAKYLSGEIQRVVIFATKYISSAVQKPVEIQLLPIVPPASGEGEGRAASGAKPRAKAAAVEFIFEPGRERILNALIPLSVKNALYRILVEAAASEQIARRLAMKLATDNAEEMIRLYTRRYNRQRQAGITQQIMEIVAGADALD